MSTERTPTSGVGEDRDVGEENATDGTNLAESSSETADRAGTARSGALTAAFDYEAVTVEHAPARTSAVVAVGAALVATAATAVSLPTLGVSALGVVLLVVGLLRGSRRALGVGLVGLLGSVAIAGVTGTPPGPLLIASAATAVAWDVGENAITLGEHLGRAADTRRAELAHAAGTIGVTTVAAVIAIVAYRLSGPRPTLALVTLLLGAVLLVIALGD